MKINLQIVPVPMISGFTMFAKIDKELLAKEKSVIVENHLITKTRVSTTLKIGEACVKINFAIDGFKTFEKTEWNHFHGKQQESNYFVVSKKQGATEYSEYVKKVVEVVVKDYLNMELDEITILLQQPRF